MHNSTLEADSLPNRIRLLMKLRTSGISDIKVLSAMEAIPREIFVPDSFYDKAYEDTALPIDSGQTISQPSVVACMTAALQVGDRMRVLEIGTGSGYQAAILSKLSRMVYTIERHKELLRVAEERFRFLRLNNILTQSGDGSKGWKIAAPFDRIMVTAASQEMPVTLIDQLAEGGIMIVPVGSDVEQSLLKIQKTANGFVEQNIMSVRFVPLVENSW
ncbi:MAG: protein-L-isoaspartate(D-aspartate) O-methyltransferase [Pseudomonadota bacterium]